MVTGRRFGIFAAAAIASVLSFASLLYAALFGATSALEPRMLWLAVVGNTTLLFAVAVGGLWQLHRRRQAFVRFEASIRPLVRGDYRHRVDVPPDSEYQGIARYLNDLATELDESLQTRRSMTDIDSLILSGANLSAIIHRSLAAARLDAVETGLLLRSDPSSVQVIMHRLDNQRVVRKIVSQLDMSANSLRDIESYRNMVGNYTDGSLLECYPVACDDQLVGVLYAAGHRTLTGVESKRLSDLVDRLSVAITNINKSESLYKQAHFDSLTGLVNRRAFEERLKESLLRSHRGEEGVVLFIDLDGFKKVNDTEGHEAGDRLLIHIAERLREAMRPEDTIARLGGDEFGIIATGRCDEKFVVRLCQRVIDSVTRPITLDRFEHSVGASVGVAIYPKDGQKLDELVMKADSAMYRAKKRNGSGYAFFDDSLSAANKHRILVESRLRSAIKDRTLELYFQPKLNVETWAVDSGEALLRWHDAKLGQVEPEEFIAIAEQTGLVHDLLPIIAEGAANLLKSAVERRVNIDSIAINASPNQLMKEGLALSLLSHLDRHGVPHEKIEVEVTESVFANDMAQVLSEVHTLRMAGIRVALDDFGTGYSSLNMLRELPLDIVKIDRSFVSELETSKQARDMVVHLIDIAASLGLQVVAEGVETGDQLNHLVDHGCDYIQGWIIGKAMPERKFTRFIDEWSVPSGQFRTIDLSAPQPTPMAEGRRGGRSRTYARRL